MPNVTINLTYLMGSPVAGAYVKAQLITPDVLTDLVIPKRHLVDGHADDAGSLVLSLIANESAPVYSYYRVRAWHPLTRQKVLDIAAFIPAQNCNLHETRYLQYPPNVDLRTLPELSVPTPFPSEDTQYAAALSLFSFFIYQQGQTLFVLFDALEGTGVGGGFPYAHSGPPEPSTIFSWIPGMPETLADQNPDDNIFVSYECLAYGEQTDLLDSEISIMNQMGIAGGAKSHARFRKITYNAASKECVEIVDAGDFAIRDLPSFDAWVYDSEAGEYRDFMLHPSFAFGGEKSGVACFEASSTIFCRAYPL